MIPKGGCNMLELYKRIKQRRIELGYSQQKVAELTGYKDRTSIAKIESGKVDLAQSKIVEFAKALNTTPAYLMGWENENNSAEKSNDSLNIAAHVDGDPLTEEEQEEVINFIKFIKSKRKDNNTK